MKKTFFYLLPLAFLITQCKRGEILTSSWKNNGIVCDGNTQDWDNPLRFSNEKIAFDVSNDQKNLYLCFLFDSKETKMKVIRSGFEVWIDTAAGNKKNTGILFVPNLQHPVKNNGHRKNDIREENDSLKSKFITNITECNVKGFLDVPNQKISAENPYDFKIAANFNQNEDLIYETAIPFSHFLRQPISKNGSVKTISLSFVIKAAEFQNQGHGRGAGMHGSGGMHGGGGEGGMHGGGRNYDSENGQGADSHRNSQNLSTTDKFHYRIKLAQN
jgi:hypothetical protein